MAANRCPLCEPVDEDVLWADAHVRVIRVGDPDYPGFCRVIWRTHVAEMTALSEAERARCMAAVFGVEQVLRELLRPDKINLASLGNQVPHLHWHVIPRFADDAHFPDPVWAARKREGRAHAVDPERLRARLREVLGASSD